MGSADPVVQYEPAGHVMQSLDATSLEWLAYNGTEWMSAPALRCISGRVLEAALAVRR